MFRLFFSLLRLGLTAFGVRSGVSENASVGENRRRWERGNRRERTLRFWRCKMFGDGCASCGVAPRGVLDRTALILLLLAGWVLPSPVHASARGGESRSFAMETTPADLSPADSVALLAAAGVVQLYQRTHDSAWPGYDLSQRPFLVYIPDRWAVLVNASGPIEGFEEYPRDWIPLGTNAVLHPGPFREAVGQLVFKLTIDSLETVAIPFSAEIKERRAGAIGSGLAFITHEAFHQHQYETFQSMEDTGSEENYPILDADNMALATLEMRILMDAIKASAKERREQVSELAREFLAVRERRWRRGDPFIAQFERTQELKEGSAKYVEVRSVGMIGDLCRDTAATPPIPAICDVFAPVTMEAYLLSEFESRLSEEALDPRDMARNRSYPVGAALGVLLDFFGVDWKQRVAAGAVGVSLPGLLREGLPAGAAPPESLAARAEGRYRYADILAGCQKLAAEFPHAAEAALRDFEAQPGLRVTVMLPISGMARSRSCRGNRWVLDGELGRDVFSKDCASYTMKTAAGEGLFLEVHNTSILEQDDQTGGSRRVSFFTREIAGLNMDGKPWPGPEPGTRSFESVNITGANFRLQSTRAGTMLFEGNRLTVRLLP